MKWQQPLTPDEVWRTCVERWKYPGPSSNSLPCTPEQLADSFQTIDGICVPLCPRFNFYTTDTLPEKLTGINFDAEDEEGIYDLYGDILKHIEIGVNDAWADDKKQEYNILSPV